MKSSFFLSAILLLGLAACKKDHTVSIDRSLLQDGPLTSQLGKLIYLGDHGNSRSTPVWGRNSNDLYITASTNILRVDLAAGKINVVEVSGGLVSGKTNENSGLIFLGKLNNQLGYYVSDFSSNRSEIILPVAENLGTLLHISGNNIFYYSSPVSTRPPCTGYCWPAPGPAVTATFQHIDKQTKQITNLENKQFRLFSPDGSQTILTSQLGSPLYVFDNSSRTIIDSADLNTSNSFQVLFFRNGILQSFDVDVLGNMVIKNFFTGQVVQQYHTDNVALTGYRASADGTTVYYNGGTLNGNSWKILAYDIASNTEKVLAELPFLAGGSLPFELFTVSEDKKKLVTQAGNDLYIKILE